MKRITLVFLVIFTITVLLTACDQKVEQESSNSSGSSKANPSDDIETFMSDLTVQINEVDIKLPMDSSDFYAKTGLTDLGQVDGFPAATDGYSIFAVYGSEDQIENIVVGETGNLGESYKFDSTKTKIVFPGGMTIDNTKGDVKNTYPYLNKGIFSTDYWFLPGVPEFTISLSFKFKGDKITRITYFDGHQ